MDANLSYIGSDDPGVVDAGTVGEEKKRLVLIKWKDIVQHADWTPAEEVSCPEFTSVGWFIVDNEEEIKIGSTLDEKDTPFGITAFPKGCVSAIKFI